MLAVQQAPRMGSQSEADAFMPFGCTLNLSPAKLASASPNPPGIQLLTVHFRVDSVDPNQEALFDAPDPAGAPLLSETDTKFLSSFFDDITSDQYNMPSFGEGLNFSDTWLDLPPQFMGTTTSFGAQSSGNDQLPSDQIDFSNSLSGSHMMPPPPPPPAPSQPQAFHQHHSDDVINAAATLLQNGSNPRATSRGKDSNTGRRPLGPPIGHLRHQALEEFKEESRKDPGEDVHDNTFTEWMFGKDEQVSSPRKTPVADLQWGSDVSFGLAQGYLPAPNKESVESHHKVQMQCLDCLEPSKSAANSRPSSPAHAYAQMKYEDVDAPPRKRRKSKNQKDMVDDEDDEDDGDFSKSGRKKKGKGASSLPSPPDSNGKRRKSAVNSKAPRENLTEEQKRENHIRSEQKRRTVIKEGFDDLCELVPGLKGGGFSKSTMLTMAGEWLEELLKGNEALASQLSSLRQ